MTPHIPEPGDKFRLRRRPTGFECVARVLAVNDETLHAKIIWTWESHIVHGYVDPRHWSEWPSRGGVTISTVLDFFDEVVSSVEPEAVAV